MDAPEMLSGMAGMAGMSVMVRANVMVLRER
jgi:hypothetical protein